MRQRPVSPSSVVGSGAPMVVAALLAVPGVASAATVVLTPLLADPSVDPKQREGVHQLISSELEFSTGVEDVKDLSAPPPTLDDRCLTDPRCLQAIATGNGGDAVFTGRMAASGQGLVLDLVYIDAAGARRAQFQVPTDATALANAMTPVVQAMLTGKGLPAPVAAPSTADLIAGSAPPPQTGNYPPPAQPTPAPLPPAVPVPEPAASDADLASMIGFHQSVNDISAEEVDSMIKFGPPPGVTSQPMMPTAAPMPAPAPQPAMAAPPAPRRDADSAEEDAELAEMERQQSAMQDLETPPPKAPVDVGHKVQFTARGGFSKYYAFNFVTGGAEAGIAAWQGLHLVAGVEVYAVKRILPADLQIKTGIYSEWNTIFPMNAGLIYKFPIGMAQPYVGADGIVVQYYKDDIGADWAGGGRFRTGCDFMFIDNFGLNVNVAAGAWFGQNWSLIQEGVGTAGFLPEVSAGTVVAF